MKKLLLISLILILTMSMASAEIVDNFQRPDDNTLGTATNGNNWIEDLDTTATFDISNNRLSFNNTGDGTNYNNIAEILFSTPNPTRVDIYGIKTTTSITNIYPYIFLANGPTQTVSNRIVYTITNNGALNALAWYNGAAWQATSYTPTIPTNFNLSFRNINYTTDTYDIYVNDNLITSGATFANPAAGLDRIAIWYTNAGTDPLAGTIDCITTNGDACEVITTPTPTTISQTIENGFVGQFVRLGYDITATEPQVNGQTFNIAGTGQYNVTSLTLSLGRNSAAEGTCRVEITNVSTITPGNSITTSNESITMTFNPPIRLHAGANISLASAGTDNIQACVFGYQVNDIRQTP